MCMYSSFVLRLSFVIGGSCFGILIIRVDHVIRGEELLADFDIDFHAVGTEALASFFCGA